MASNPPPLITFINPTSGPLAGGTEVTINGQNFLNGCRVRFGGIDSAQVGFLSSNQITAITPTQTAPGAVNIRLINPDGQVNVLQDAFQYLQPQSPPPPTIAFINPSSGPLTGGTQVTINGQDFVNGCRVKFGGVDSPQVSFINSDQIIAATPAQAVAGAVNVRVVNPDGQAGVLDSAYQYTQPAPPPAPSIASVNPNSGPLAGGTSVVINGQNFASGCIVRFGGIDSPQVSFINSTQVNAITPSQTTPGPVNVRLVNPDGQAGVLNNAFQYTQPAPPPAPSIASVNPNSGPLAGGTSVIIFGQNFAQGCTVRFGGIDSAQVAFNSSGQLTAITPSQTTPGTVNVRVVNPDGQAGVLQSAFQYVQPAPAPLVSSINPAFGPLSGGTQVSISGQNFVNGCRIKFGGVDAPTTFNSSNQLTAITPSQTVAGPVNVRVVNPDGQAGVLNNAFEYQQPPPPPTPMVASVTPNSGPLSGGTEVTINGQNFVSGCTVRFGGIDSAQVGFLSSNQITAITPAQTAPGAVNVRVVNASGQAGVLQNAFQYVQPPPTPAPMIASVTPASGPLAGGTSVVINGQNFVAGCQVKFGTVNAPQVAFNNSNQITATAPPRATAGPVDVQLINPDGKAGTLPGAFRYVAPAPAPVTVQVIAPNGGETVAAGTPLNIKWTSSNATEHRVEYALDGSASFTQIATGLAGTAQSFTWNIPANIVAAGKTQVQAKIRIVARNSSAAQEASDTSDGSFTITAPPKPTGLQAVRGGRNKIGPQVANCSTTGASSIAAGQTAKYCEGVVVKDQFGNLIPDVQVTLRLDGARPPGLTTDISPNPVRTCEAGETSGCSDFTVSLQTTTNTTPPDTYKFDVIASCTNCNTRNIITLSLTVEEPTIKVQVTPGTPDMLEVFAGGSARYSLDVEKRSYLGPIQVGSAGSIDNTITALPFKIDRDNKPDEKFTGTLTVTTIMPKGDEINGTPPGEYTLQTDVLVPREATKTNATLKLIVKIRPDIFISVSPQTKTVKAEPGSQAVFTLILFRYNFEGPVDFSISGLPPRTAPPTFVAGASVNLPKNIGRKVKYTVTIDVPEDAKLDLYPLSFFAMAKVVLGQPPVTRDASADLDVQITQITLTPNMTSAQLGPTESVTFDIGIAPRKVDLKFFTEMVSSPADGAGEELLLDHLYDLDPVPRNSGQVKLMVSGSNRRAPLGDYVFKVGGKRVGTQDLVTTTPQLTVSLGEPELVLSTKNNMRTGSFGNDPIFTIKVKRTGYRGPLRLRIRDLPRGVISNFPPVIKDTPPDPAESNTTLILKIKQNAPVGTYTFFLFSDVPDIRKNELELTLKVQ
jgi:hypothetical protein